VFEEKFDFPKESKEMELVFETIKSLRNVRQGFNIPPSVKVNIEIRAEKDEQPIFKEVLSYIKRLARVEEISFADETAPVPKKSATAVVSSSKIIIPLEDLIDLNAEISRQQKKLDKLLAEKNSLTGRLSNKKFVDNAPKEVIEETQAKVDEISVQQEIIEKLIDSLK
jgi:valyl-tRNA synthetase